MLPVVVGVGFAAAAAYRYLREPPAQKACIASIEDGDLVEAVGGVPCYVPYNAESMSDAEIAEANAARQTINGWSASVDNVAPCVLSRIVSSGGGFAHRCAAVGASMGTGTEDAIVATLSVYAVDGPPLSPEEHASVVAKMIAEMDESVIN